MTDVEKISVGIHDTVVDISNTLTLPTHRTLVKNFKLSLALSALSFLSELLGFYTFISWQGSILCSCMLFAFMYVERGNSNDLSRVCSPIKLHATNIARRAKDAGSSIRSRRVTDGSSEFEVADGEGQRPDTDESVE